MSPEPEKRSDEEKSMTTKQPGVTAVNWSADLTALTDADLNARRDALSRGVAADVVFGRPHTGNVVEKLRAVFAEDDRRLRRVVRDIKEQQ